MNKELKEQAHKEFDEKASKGASKGGFLADYYDDYDAVDFDTDLILNFIDSLIDKTVQMTEERIVGVMLNQEQNFKQLWKEYKGTKTKGEFYSYLVTNKK